MTLNGHWGYTVPTTSGSHPRWSSANIADIVSKGGNYLPTSAPTAEGEIPPRATASSRRSAAWPRPTPRRSTGRAPTPFARSWAPRTPSKRTGRQAALGTGTTGAAPRSPAKLYFTRLKWPGARFALPVLREQVTQAYLLADPAHTPLTVSGGSVALPATAPPDWHRCSASRSRAR